MTRTFRTTFIAKTVCKMQASGCEVTPRTVRYEKHHIEASTFAGLVEKAKLDVYHPDPKDGYVFMPDGIESGHFCFSLMEDYDGNVIYGATKVPGFEDGTKHLWCADYTFAFEVTVEDDLTEADLDGLTLE